MTLLFIFLILSPLAVVARLLGLLLLLHRPGFLAVMTTPYVVLFLESLSSLLLLTLHNCFVFFLDAIGEDDTYLSLFELVHTATRYEIDEDGLLHFEGVELFFEHLVDEKAHDHPLDGLFGILGKTAEESLSYVIHFGVLRCVVYPLSLTLKEFDDLEHSKVHAFFHGRFNQVHNIPGLFSEVNLCDLKIFLAIVAFLVTVTRPKIFTEVVELDLTSTKVWLLTELDDFVQSVKILVFSAHGVVRIGHYEVFQALTIGIRIVKNTVSGLAIASCPTHLLSIVFETLG